MRRTMRRNQGQRFFKHKMTRIIPVVLGQNVAGEHSIGFAW